jgi:hypothetical protein
MSLIEPALAQSSRVERNWHDRVIGLILDARIIEGLPEPVSKNVPQVKLATVFHPVNDFSDDAAGPVTGHRATKRKMAVLTIRTDEFLRNSSAIGSGTSFAKRRFDLFSGRLA